MALEAERRRLIAMVNGRYPEYRAELMRDLICREEFDMPPTQPWALSQYTTVEWEEGIAPRFRNQHTAGTGAEVRSLINSLHYRSVTWWGT